MPDPSSGDVSARRERMEKIALFRYQLVREAADESVTSRQRGPMVRALAQKEHPGPFGGTVVVAKDTIDRWIRLWRRGGFDALKPHGRTQGPVHIVQQGLGEWAGKSRSLRAQSPQTFGKVYPESLTRGRVPTSRNEVAMDQAMAQQHNVRVGSRMKMILGPQRQPVTMTVTGLYAESEAAGLGPFITVPATLTGASLPSQINLIGIDLRGKADPTTVRTEIDRALADSPLIKVLDRQRIVDERLDLIENLLALVKAILALSVLVAALGIINTLALSISERVREIGLLRAVGLTRLQLRWMIGIEAVSVAVLGCAIGAALGLLVGVALQHGLAPRGLTILDIPKRQLAAAMAASVLLGVIAAAWPARLAARINIVRAVSTQ